jgi:ribosome-associated translation inhibitor RaiA
MLYTRMNIDIEGISRAQTFKDAIVRRIIRIVRRVHGEPTSAVVNFNDINGARHGVDIQCSLTVWLPSRRTVHVDAMGDTPGRAFHDAAEALDHRLRRVSERAITVRRRPKKYYVARLLESEAVTPESAAARRRRRRKAA